MNPQTAMSEQPLAAADAQARAAPPTRASPAPIATRAQSTTRAALLACALLLCAAAPAAALPDSAQCRVLSFDDLAGDIVGGVYPRVTDQFSDVGVTLWATTASFMGAPPPLTAPELPLTVFPTYAPTGGDPDLGAPNMLCPGGGPGSGCGGGPNITENAGSFCAPVLDLLGNDIPNPHANCEERGLVLIVQGGNDFSDPGDYSLASVTFVQFASPVRVREIGMLDLEEGSGGGTAGTIAMFATNDTALPPVAEENLGVGGDNSFVAQEIQHADEDVVVVRIFKQRAGGAVDTIRFCTSSGSITASATFTRAYTWSVQTSVQGDAEYDLFVGESANVSFSAVVLRDDGDDSFKIEGTATAFNELAIPMNVTGATAVTDLGEALNVDCNVSFSAGGLAPGDGVECAFWGAVQDSRARVVTFTLSTGNRSSTAVTMDIGVEFATEPDLLINQDVNVVQSDEGFPPTTASDSQTFGFESSVACNAPAEAITGSTAEFFYNTTSIVSAMDGTELDSSTASVFARCVYCGELLVTTCEEYEAALGAQGALPLACLGDPAYTKAACGTPVIGNATVVGSAAGTSCASDGTLRVLNASWTATFPSCPARQLSRPVRVVDATPPTLLASRAPPHDDVSCAADVRGALPNVTCADEWARCLPDANVSCAAEPGVCDPEGADGCQDGVYVATWTAVDACGLVGSLSVSVRARDLSPPTITGRNGTYKVECNGRDEGSVRALLDANFSAVEDANATDDCDGVDVEIPTTHWHLERVDSCSVLATRSVFVSDACGNEAGRNVTTVTFSDSKPPYFLQRPPEPVGRFDSCAVADALLDNDTHVVAKDTCDGDIDVVMTDSPVVGCPSVYVWNRTWATSDECGHTVTFTRTVIVNDTSPPNIEWPFSADPVVELAPDGSPNSCTLRRCAAVPSNESVCDGFVPGDRRDAVLLYGGDNGTVIERATILPASESHVAFSTLYDPALGEFRRAVRVSVVLRLESIGGTSGLEHLPETLNVSGVSLAASGANDAEGFPLCTASGVRRADVHEFGFDAGPSAVADASTGFAYIGYGTTGMSTAYGLLLRLRFDASTGERRLLEVRSDLSHDCGTGSVSALDGAPSPPCSATVSNSAAAGAVRVVVCGELPDEGDTVRAESLSHRCGDNETFVESSSVTLEELPRCGRLDATALTGRAVHVVHRATSECSNRTTWTRFTVHEADVTSVTFDVPVAEETVTGVPFCDVPAPRAPNCSDSCGGETNVSFHEFNTTTEGNCTVHVTRVWECKDECGEGSTNFTRHFVRMVLRCLR